MAKQQNAKKSTPNDVYTMVNEKIIDHLKKGIVPWRRPWTAGGVPTSFRTGNPFRGINVMLLAALGYERNLFLTENYLKEIGGAIRPGERAHAIVYWKTPKEGEETDDTESKLRSYLVYNVAQCASVSYEMTEFDGQMPIDLCEEIIDRMPHKPTIKHKEPKPFYDPTEDILNIPKKAAYEPGIEYYAVLLHQLVHSTGHHTRLNRMGLVQMPEFGCDPFTLEELIAEIATSYLLSYMGIQDSFVITPAYLQGWIERLGRDKYLIFNASTLAQKALDFIFDIREAENAATVPDDAEEVTAS